MQPGAAAEQKNEQRRKPNGRPWPPGVSGNPSGRKLGKRYLALFADLVRDLGGEDVLTGIDRALLGQAVGLMVRAERVKETDDAVRLANASARLLASLRTKHQRPPAQRETFADIAARAQAEADQRRARELAEDEAEPSLATPVQAPSLDAILNDTAARESAFDPATAPAEAAEDEDAEDR